ncbi:MAG: DUF1501 domain-containing protein, partial [Planctomycetota bacterium]|nr:DUF1501 domain-containing protein [Planctomycetota bacterium]
MNTNFSRRDFLKTASAATLSAMAANYPRRLLGADAAEPKINPTADAVIVLWMAGGMAHTETFDPKRYTPFEKGMDPNVVLSTFPSIDSVVDNIKISQGLENVAKVMDRATLIRSYKAGDLGFILHSRHQYQWHTGYAPPQTVATPHIGSVIARTLGPRNDAMPAYVDIGQRIGVGGEDEELKAFRTAGFLGSEYGPFFIPEPAEAVSSISPPKGMNPGRFADRNKFYKEMIKNSPVGEFGSDFQKESLLRSMENAHRLLSSPAAKAFDLTQEPKESYDKYNTGRFG